MVQSKRFQCVLSNKKILLFKQLIHVCLPEKTTPLISYTPNLPGHLLHPDEPIPEPLLRVYTSSQCFTRDTGYYCIHERILSSDILEIFQDFYKYLKTLSTWSKNTKNQIKNILLNFHYERIMLLLYVPLKYIIALIES